MFQVRRFLRTALIDVVVLISLALAAGHQCEGAVMNRTYICGLGAAVINQRVLVDPAVFLDGAHAEAAFNEVLSGGCLNGLRAAQRLGIPCRPLVLVGDDPARAQVEWMLRDEFDDALTLPILARTPRSVMCGAACVTALPTQSQQALPVDALNVVGQADLVLVAPLSAADTALVAEALRRAKRSVLQLAESQVADAVVAAQLSRLASWTVIKRQELARWSGCESLEAGLLVLQGLGVENLIVTGRTEVTVMFRGDVEVLPQEAVEVQTSTVGNADCFIGTFAAMLVEGQPWREAIRMAQAAENLHLLGMYGALTPAQLEEAALELPAPVALPPLPFRQRGRQMRLANVVAAALLGAGVTLATLAGVGAYLT